MELTLKDRLTAIATSNNITVAAFERACGFCNGYVRTVNESIGSDKIESIIKVFPNISILWIITGLGPMLNNSDNSNSQNSKFSNNRTSFNNFQYTSDAALSLLKSELDKKNEQIDRMIKLLEYIVYQGGKGEFMTIETSPESRQNSSK